MKKHLAIALSTVMFVMVLGLGLAVAEPYKGKTISDDILCRNIPNCISIVGRIADGNMLTVYFYQNVFGKKAFLLSTFNRLDNNLWVFHIQSIGAALLIQK